MNSSFDPRLHLTRRQFFGRAGIGATALAALLNREALVATTTPPATAGGLPGLPHFAPKAKRVIYLFQSGAPSQLDLFDYKPALEKQHGVDLPIRSGRASGSPA